MPESVSSYTKPSNGWIVTYPGVSLSGHYNHDWSVYTLTIAPPDERVTSRFSLNLPCPLRRTSVLLPGATTAVQISAEEEVRVMRMGFGKEALRLWKWFDEVVSNDDLLTIVQQRYGDSVHARCAVVGKETFVVVNCYRFVDW